jgi:hypothetical protein
MVSDYCRSRRNLLEGSSNVVYQRMWIEFLNIIIASEVNSLWKIEGSHTALWCVSEIVELFELDPL